VHILITGANGFIGKNLSIFLREQKDINVSTFTREDNQNKLPSLLKSVDYVVHLAGINRPKKTLEFTKGNTELTKKLCDFIEKSGRIIPVIYTSSIQAKQNNEYGKSKFASEQILKKFRKDTGNPTYIYRLQNVFGKWAKNNYNSVVATYCYNISRKLPIHISDPSNIIKLVYIDDVMESILEVIRNPNSERVYINIETEHKTTLGELADRIYSFSASRENLITERVGSGFLRELYSTYLSYIPKEYFSYKIPKNTDARGDFVEFLKTLDSGQFSFFTAYPGITRGGHFHHTKSEKFLVIRGKAHFRFCNISTNEIHELVTNEKILEVVETVPGWAHDITNIGQEEMIVLLWANENFNIEKPDTTKYILNTR